MSTENSTPTQVSTGAVLVIFPELFEAKKMKGQPNSEPKFSCTILIPKDDTYTLPKILAGIEAAKELGVQSKWGGKMPPTTGPKAMWNPLRDGDVEHPDKELYEGMYFMVCKSSSQPSVVDRAGKAIMKQTEIYGGIKARLQINFYPFDTAGSKGLAVGLNHLMKWSDGTPLGGNRVSIDEAFADDYDDANGDY